MKKEKKKKRDKREDAEENIALMKGSEEAEVSLHVTNNHMFPIAFFHCVSVPQNDIVFIITLDTRHTESLFIFVQKAACLG